MSGSAGADASVKADGPSFGWHLKAAAKADPKRHTLNPSTFADRVLVAAMADPEWRDLDPSSFEYRGKVAALAEKEHMDKGNPAFDLSFLNGTKMSSFSRLLFRSCFKRAQVVR